MAKKTIKGKTSTGFTFEIEKARLDNYELVEVISEVDTNPLVFPRMLKLLLGDQTVALKDHVRDEDGFVSTEKLAAEVSEIFNSNQAKK